MNTERAPWGEVTQSAPILVSGAYRSGTTFLSSLIGAHPDLQPASSKVKFMRFCLGRYGDVSDPATRVSLLEDLQRRLIVRWGLDFNAESLFHDADLLENPSYALLYDKIMRLHLVGDPLKPVRWVEKLAVAWSHIPTFLTMFPQGLVVHVVRDPRDVVASYKSMTFEEGNTFLDAAFNCRGSMELQFDLREEFRSRVLLVKLEDFHYQRDTVLEAIAGFLGVDVSESMQNPSSFAAIGDNWMTNTSFGTPHRGWPVPRARWREVMSYPETLFTELVTQPRLVDWGYQPSCVEPTVDDWTRVFELIDSPFLKQRFSDWLALGRGAEGYRTDPYDYEMSLVFPGTGV